MGWFSKNPKAKEEILVVAIRDTLFGDLPIEQWPASKEMNSIPPWNMFIEAQGLVAAGNTAQAVECWKNIVGTPALEPRHYLQAWHYLRQNGIQPTTATAKKLYGVVVEVPMPGGLDLLAAYSDQTARYYNYQAGGVIWEHPDSSLDKLINDLLATAENIVAQIGPWEGNRPAQPPDGQIRLSFLTPSGLHFGQGPFEQLQRDPIGGPAVQAATQLMLAMVEKGLSSKS